MSTSWAIICSLILLAGNGFFVAAEFALVASKRYRLEHAAAEGSRAARAALDGSRDLALMLAGAQLGITLCTLGLGALAEPAIEHLTHPLLHAVGLPDVASGVIAFLLALVVVTFLHLVIGEMMPKSWAITDPERSATILALPFRTFVRAIRPALVGLNGLANAALKPFGVHAQDQLAQAHGPEEMNILLERSRAEGLLEAEQTELLTSMLKLQETKVRDLLIPDDQLVTVSPGSSAAEVEAASQRSGRSRLAVVAPAFSSPTPSSPPSASSVSSPASAAGSSVPASGGAGSGDVVGVVHVREAVRATTAGVPATAAQLMDPPFDLEASVTVTDAVTRMRAARAQLAMVTRDGERVGFVALEDLLEQVIGEFDDETDPVPVGRRMR
jgi:CBS domain containing-hemolysin-like protein